MKIGKGTISGNVTSHKLSVTREKADCPLDKVTLGENAPDMSFLINKDIKDMKSARFKKPSFGKVMGGFAGAGMGAIGGLALFGALSPTGALAAATGVGAVMAISSAIYYGQKASP